MRRLTLNTLDNSVKTLGRLLRDFHRDDGADVNRFRAMIYGFSVFLNGWKLVKDGEYEERIAEIERMLELRRYE